MAACRAVKLAEQAVQNVADGPIKLKWQEMRLDSIHRLMLITSNWVEPY